MDLGHADRTHSLDPDGLDSAGYRLAWLGEALSPSRGSCVMTMMNARLLRAGLLGVSLVCLAGCNDGSGDPKVQLGANPNLPDQNQFLVPPMHVARVVGWSEDHAPTA